MTIISSVDKKLINYLNKKNIELNNWKIDEKTQKKRGKLLHWTIENVFRKKRNFLLMDS